MHYLFFILTMSFLVVFCLSPLCVYLHWLAAINRRSKPTVLEGSWDFAALIAALSGFLIVGGGLLVFLLQSDSRIIPSSSWHEIREAWQQANGRWLLIAGGYSFLVTTAIVAAFLQRAGHLAVYNVSCTQMDDVLERVFTSLGVPAQRVGNEWRADRSLLITQASPHFHHVGITLMVEGRPAEELVRSLRQELAQVASETHPIERYLSSTALGILVTILVFLLGLVFILYSPGN